MKSTNDDDPKPYQKIDLDGQMKLSDFKRTNHSLDDFTENN